jgi:hypothetical protein
MGAWFWLNIPLTAPIFLVTRRISLWLVFRGPDTGSRGKHGEPRSDQGSGRSSSSRRLRSSTIWRVNAFCETRQLAGGSRRG